MVILVISNMHKAKPAKILKVKKVTVQIKYARTHTHTHTDSMSRAFKVLDNHLEFWQVNDICTCG